MELTPTVIKVSSEEELKTKCEEYKTTGRRVIDCNVVEDGVVGRLAFLEPPANKDPDKWTREETDAHWIIWEKFGRVLIPEKIQVKTGNELFTLYNEHHDHEVIGFTNSETKTAGFICFCRAHEGVSIVFTTELRDIKEIPPGLLAMMKSTRSV